MSDSHPLVCRFGAFGDMVMLTPLLKRLYRRCGKPCDVVGIGPWTEQMYQHMPYVRHVYTLKSRKLPYFLSWRKHLVAGQLRSRQYAFAWICEQSPYSYELLAKGGMDISRTINANDLTRGSEEHNCEQWMRLANESPPGFDFAVDSDDTVNTELFVSRDEQQACRQWLQSLSIADTSPLICIQPGNKKTMRSGRADRLSNTKYWHPQNWAAVIDAVCEQIPQASILLCGVPSEYRITTEIRQLCRQPQRIHCVARELPMRRLLALLSLSHSCISVDTGPAHAAAALNCPVTVLFGKADARHCRPVSSESRVGIVTGRIPGSKLSAGPDSWAQCHDISLIQPGQVISTWLDTIAPAAPDSASYQSPKSGNLAG